jgi:FemAB family protein
MDSQFDVERLRELIASLGISVRFRSEVKQDWNDAEKLLLYSPVTYGYSTLDYELEYQRSQGGEWLDISLMIYWNNRFAALWPLSFSTQDGQGLLSSHGLPVLPPLFAVDCPSKSRKRITKSCLDLAEAIAKNANLGTWESGESFTDSVGMTNWHTEAMNRFAECRVQYDLFLDIRPDMREIKRNFRRSYKPMISRGMRAWQVDVIIDSNQKAWDEYRALHFQVAGRRTRSSKSWQMQHMEIEERRALLITLRNQKGQLVGGGFFRISRDEGSYSVGVYDRDLFDKPLGHVVQYRAIEEMKKRGIRWYNIGRRPYPSEVLPVTEQEIQISNFKQGFASHFFPRYLLNHRR